MYVDVRFSFGFSFASDVSAQPFVDAATNWNPREACSNVLCGKAIPNPGSLLSTTRKFDAM